MPAAAFPWDEVMAIGFGMLRLSSQAFWAMTPREFERAVNMTVPQRGAAPTRDALATLMAAFPDMAERNRNG